MITPAPSKRGTRRWHIGAGPTHARLFVSKPIDPRLVGDLQPLEPVGIHLEAPPIVDLCEATFDLVVDRAMPFDEFAYALARYLMPSADVEEQVWGVECPTPTAKRGFRRRVPADRPIQGTQRPPAMEKH